MKMLFGFKVPAKVTFACRFPYSTKNKVFSQELDTLKYISYLFAGATLFIFEVSMQIIYTLKLIKNKIVLYLNREVFLSLYNFSIQTFLNYNLKTCSV